LDGVVDTPGRIVIMTTNHPELLDPALIRPGRIDKKIMLGYMNWSAMVEMVELYFSTILEDDHADRLRRIATALSLTPAELEQLAAENDLVEDLLAQLEDRAGLTAAMSETSMESSSLPH
jgi:mitochondrial chaperone BCS1